MHLRLCRLIIVSMFCNCPTHAVFSAQGGSSHLNKPEDILQSTVDSAEWKLEVERVLPQLRVTVQPDAKVSQLCCRAVPWELCE